MLLNMLSISELLIGSLFRLSHEPVVRWKFLLSTVNEDVASISLSYLLAELLGSQLSVLVEYAVDSGNEIA